MKLKPPTVLYRQQNSPPSGKHCVFELRYQEAGIESQRRYPNEALLRFNGIMNDTELPFSLPMKS